MRCPEMTWEIPIRWTKNTITCLDFSTTMYRKRQDMQNSEMVFVMPELQSVYPKMH